MLKRVLLVACAAFLVATCAAFAAETKTLTCIGPWSGAEMEAFLPVLQAFEKETGIKVEYRIYRGEDLSAQLPAQFSAKTAPGDVIFMWAWFIAKQGEAGHALDLTGVVKDADYLPGALDSLKVGGKVYGIAYTGKVKPGFWYRKSFFQKHGLTPPKTWEEFVALLDKIAKIPGIKAPIVSGDGVGWPLSDVTEHFIATFGGPQLHKELTEGAIAWTDPVVKGIFEGRLVPLLRAKRFSEPIEWTQALELWWQGDYGLYFMGSWITGMVKDPNDLGVFSLPGARGIVFGADYAFVPKYSKNPEEAKKLIQSLATKGQEVQVAQGGHIATYVKVPLEAYPPVDRGVAELLTGRVALSDMDDTIGGEWQPTFWDQLKLMWVRPERYAEVLDTLEKKAP
ncbi:MAG: ABC transporter substrate-binding protein [Firmicutes bacterium]|nr:ABC transporter substrate-binding protein [Bacillota bacterium]MDH7495424.1 ABC transporter substrate-binding protein [Bacillota bacterium]